MSNQTRIPFDSAKGGIWKSLFDMFIRLWVATLWWCLRRLRLAGISCTRVRTAPTRSMSNHVRCTTIKWRNQCIYASFVENLCYVLPSKQQNFSKNVRLDPTLPRARDVVCKECGERGAVYFQAHGANNQAMSLIYVCVNCGAFWDNREKEEQ